MPDFSHRIVSIPELSGLMIPVWDGHRQGEQLQQVVGWDLNPDPRAGLLSPDANCSEEGRAVGRRG